MVQFLETLYTHDQTNSNHIVIDSSSSNSKSEFTKDVEAAKEDALKDINEVADAAAKSIDDTADTLSKNANKTVKDVEKSLDSQIDAAKDSLPSDKQKENLADSAKKAVDSASKAVAESLPKDPSKKGTREPIDPSEVADTLKDYWVSAISAIQEAGNSSIDAIKENPAIASAITSAVAAASILCAGYSNVNQKYNLPFDHKFTEKETGMVACAVLALGVGHYVLSQRKTTKTAKK